MNEINEKFQEYMNEVKKLDINGKRKELYDSLFHFAHVIQDMALEENMTLHYIRNREIEDLYQDDLSEDDYLEGMIVYFEMVKNMVGEYLLNKHGE